VPLSPNFVLHQKVKQKRRKQSRDFLIIARICCITVTTTAGPEPMEKHCMEEMHYSITIHILKNNELCHFEQTLLFT